MILPASVTTVGKYAFDYCSSLKKGAYPSGLSNPFSNGIGIEYPKDGAIIEDGFIYGLEKNTIYFAPLSLEGEYVIPNSVNSIGYGAFANCSDLTSVTIPNSVNSIGNGAFYGCFGLKKSAYPSGLSNPFSNGIGIEYPKDGAIIEDGFIYGLEKNTIYFAPLSLEGEYVIPNSVNSIGYGAFANCSGMTSVTIPNSVTEIANSAFSDCSGLTSVTIPNSVNSIGDQAFNGCSGLKTFTVEDGESLIAFGNDALSQAPVEHLYIGRNWSNSSNDAIPTGITSVEISNSVTQLPNYAFSDCSGLTSVTIPNSVTSIGNGAFYGCSGMTSVTIPNSVNSIGTKAFYSCSNLKELVIENSESKLHFGDKVFESAGLSKVYLGRNFDYEGQYTYSGPFYRSNISELTISSNVTNLYPGSFQGCHSIATVEIPNSVTEIGYSAFGNCLGLTSVTIPNSVNSIGDEAFYGCISLTSVTIPTSVNSIGDQAFNGCSGLKKSAYPSGLSNPFSNGIAIEYPREGSIIEDGFVFGPEKNAIYFAPLSLEGEYIIPTSVNSIGKEAFEGCSGLTSVTIPNSVSSIGDQAFDGCSGLTSVTIPNSVNSIGNGAFYGCSGLKTFTVEDGENLIAFGNDALYRAPIEHLYIGRNWSNSSNDAISTGITSVEISNSVTQLPNYAFENCSGLTSVAIPNSVTSIGNSAFYGCSGMTSVIIGNSVTSIGNSAFSGCSGMTSVAIPNSVISIGNRAFYGCSGMTSVIIGNSVSSIAYQAFNGCSGLTSVTIPNSVNSIDNYAFSGCFGLTSVIIGNSVSSIGDQAFNGCSGLTSVTIPNSVNSIGKEAFEGCSGLKKSAYPSGLSNPFSHGTTIQYPREGAIIEDGFVYGPEKSTIYFAPLSLEGEYVIPESVTSIGSSAFEDCSGLTGLTIKDSGENLHFGENVFSNAGLRNVYLGRNFDYEGQYTSSGPFYNSKISELTISSTVTKIAAGAFHLCESLTSVEIPNSVNSIGKEAFSRCSGLTSVTIPNSVTTIGTNAFYSCSNLKELVIENSESKLYFGEEVFESAGLSKVYLGRNFDYEGQYISSGPFFNSKISELTISSTVTKIASGAFYLCESLTSVEIPNSVTSIGKYAFSRCSGLTSVTAMAANPPLMNDNSFEGLYATAALSVPEGAANDYLATNWSLFENLRSGDSDEALKTYETGNLKYRLIPAQTAADRNLAIVIPGNYSSLTEVTIPERFTVSENGNNVRYYVDGIGFKAFNGCSDLATITFNSRNASRIIGEYAFAGTKIAALSIPETVETIGNRAFQGCKSLTGIVIPGSVESIGDYAFYSCTALTKANLEAGVKTIGDYAFNSCTALTKANLEAGVKTIGDYAFNSCTALTEITVPGSVETIGNYAFNSCTALTKANLEAGVKTIGDYAFYNTPLNEITLNEGLETIGEKCFSASIDRDIEPVYIPTTLKSVGADAFLNFNCRYVNISDLAPWCDIDFGNKNSNPAAHRQGMYLNGDKIEDLVIPESVNAIKDFAFCYNSGLKSVKFNDALQSIGESAFKYCGGLTAAVIPGNVTAISSQAFASTGIKDITFAYSANPIEIATDAFPAPTSLSWDRPAEGMNLDVNSLESLTIGNSLTEIPAAKFKGVSSLTSLTLGNSLTTIGDEAFSGCTALTEVILPPSVETIGASAFAGNSKLTSIIMGHKVTSIGEKAYDLCPAQTVSITAQTPPTAPDNTFSNYTGSLYVQGQQAADAYYDADYCWYQFEGHVMIEPTEFKVEGDKTLNGKPGDTFQLKATLYPTDVTLSQVFWRSTNPDIATVDVNGLVTLHADMSQVMAMAEGDDDNYTRSCKIIAESLYADGPVAEFSINDVTTDIEDVIVDGGNESGDIDFSAPVEIYNLQGVRVSDSVENLSNGIYIVRQGNNVRKIAVK